MRFTRPLRPSNPPLGNENVLLAVVAAAIVIVEISSLALLDVYPPVFVDEPWNANAAWTWLTTGVHFDAIHTGTLDQFGYAWLRRPFLGDIPWVVSFALFGLGLLQARLVSWAFGAVLLIATYVAGRLAYDRLTGALAALFLSIGYPFLYSSHLARQDILLAALAMIAYVLAFRALHENSRWLALSTGLVLGLSMDVHQNAALFIIGLSAMYVAFYGWRIIREPMAWLTAVGGVLGLGYFLVLRVLPSPSAYSAMFRFNAARWNRSLVLDFNVKDLLTSLHNTVGMFHFYDHPVQFLLTGASVVYVLARWKRPDRLLIGFAAGVVVGFVVLTGISWKPDHYAILLFPFMCLMVGRAFAGLLRRPDGGTGTRLFVAAILVVSVGTAAWQYFRPILGSERNDYYTITEKIKRAIPERTRVMGSPTWWLGFHDVEYRSSLNVTYYDFYNHLSIRESLEIERPGVFIVDDFVRFQFSGENGVDFYPGAVLELYKILDERGTLVLEVETADYGRVSVYTLTWDESSVVAAASHDAPATAATRCSDRMVSPVLHPHMTERPLTLCSPTIGAALDRIDKS